MAVDYRQGGLIAWSTMGMRRVAIMLCVLAAGCAGTYPSPLSTSLVNEAIVAVLAARHDGHPDYCLRVFDRRPSYALELQLRQIGQRVDQCREDGMIYRITRVQPAGDGSIAVDQVEDGGPLNRWGSRSFVRRGAAGELEVERHVLTFES